MSRLVTELDLPELDFGSEAFATDPWDLMADLAERSWVVQTGFGPFVMSHAGCHALLRNPDIRFATEVGMDEAGMHRDFLLERSRRNLLHLYGPAHTRLRRFVSRAFSPRAVERVVQRMRARIDATLDDVAPTGHADLVADVAHLYPAQIICELIGAPVEDAPMISDWVEVLFTRFAFDMAATVDAIIEAQAAMDGYIRALIERRRDEPGDDLLSDLLAIEAEGERLQTGDVVVLIDNLLTAGTDTTRNQLAAAAHLLAEFPAERDRVLADPSLVDGAVEEALRLRPVVAGTLRHCMVDVEIDDVVFPAGTVVGAGFVAANLDPAVYPDPRRLDVGRVHDQPVLSFGAGAHFCVGAALARAELSIGLGAVLDRLGRYEVDGDVEWKSLVGINGPVSLPLRWDPRDRAATR